MKKLTFVLLFVTLVSLAAAADVSGNWSGTWTPENGNAGSAYLVLKQSGATLTGSAGPDAQTQWPIANGKVAGDTVTLQVTDTQNIVYKCTLSVNGNKMIGSVEVSANGQTQKAKIELSRAN